MLRIAFTACLQSSSGDRSQATLIEKKTNLQEITKEVTLE
jgi:hypothetical protein